MRILPTRVVYEEEYGGYSIEVWFILWWYVDKSFTFSKEKACERLRKYKSGESLTKVYTKTVVKC